MSSAARNSLAVMRGTFVPFSTSPRSFPQWRIALLALPLLDAHIVGGKRPGAAFGHQLRPDLLGAHALPVVAQGQKLLRRGHEPFPPGGGRVPLVVAAGPLVTLARLCEMLLESWPALEQLAVGLLGRLVGAEKVEIVHRLASSRSGLFEL